MSTSSWRRRARAAFTLNPAPRRWPVALKAAVTMVIVLGAAQAMGQLSLGMLASLGSFAVLYGPGTAARYRLRLLLAVGLGLVVSAGAGAYTAHVPWLEVLALGVTASVAAFICVSLRIGPPGAFFLVLVHGVSGLAASHGAQPATIVTAAAAGAVVAVIVGMSDLVADPNGPQRRAVEAAEAAMTRFEEASDVADLPVVRAATSTALHTAWTVVTDAGSQPRWTDRLWQVQARYVAGTARVTGGVLGIDPAPWGSPGGEDERVDDVQLDLQVDESRTPAVASRIDLEQIRDTSLGRPGAVHVLRRAARWPSEVLLVAARAGLAALVAGSIARLFGSEHLYWAAAFATLVLHQGGTREAQIVRAVQRLSGTVVGLGVFAALQAVGVSGWGVVAVVGVLQFVVEMLIVRNYALAVVGITPLALTIGSHASAANPSTGALVADRAIDTIIAIVVALVVLATVGRRTSVVLLRGYARTVVHGIDAVLADLAAGREQTPEARENRRRLYHELLESDQIARRAVADDPERVGPYREMERSLSHLGYVVLGMAWHPDARTARGLSDAARAPLARIMEHPVTRPRPAADIHADVLAVERAITTWRPDAAV